jgi:uncharacterized integral membrane protein
VAKDDGPQASPNRRVSPREVVAAVLGLLILIFVVENTRSVHIRFIFPQVKAPLALALILAFVAGVGAGLLLRRRRKDSS